MAAPSTPPAKTRNLDDVAAEPRTSYMARLLDVKRPPKPSVEARWETDYNTLGLLGQGDFGRVYAAEDVVTQTRGCLKVVEGRSSEGDLLALLQAHPAAPACLLRLLSGPWLDRDGCSCLFMESLPVSRLSRGSMDPDAAATCAVARDLAVALTFLAEVRIVHNDVKPENAGCRGDGTAVLYDYGLSHGAREGGHDLGSREFLAPEMGRLPLSHFERGDCYALGMTLAQVPSPGCTAAGPRGIALGRACAGLLSRDYSGRLSAASALAILP